MDNTSSGDMTNSRINPFSIENILSPPSSQTLQNVVSAASAQAHPQLYYMAFMLQQQIAAQHQQQQQQQQQHQHFRHLQQFQQQQQYLQSFFLLQQQIQQQQHLLPQKQLETVTTSGNNGGRHHNQLSQRHLLQAHQQHLQQAAAVGSSHQQSNKQKSHQITSSTNITSPTTPPPPPIPSSLPISAPPKYSSPIKAADLQQHQRHSDEQSTALSSLSSFVARIEPLQGGGATGSSQANNKKQIPTLNTSGSKQSSGTGSPAPSKPKQLSHHSATTTTPSPISSAATTTNPLNSTINTAINIAKAPPELVQKQPAWVFCTRYSDRPSSGPRTRRAKSKDKKAKETKASSVDEKRPRTAFTNEQLEKLRQEFQANSYLDERRRKDLAERLCLNENQIKIWFQNKRAKIKKQSNQPNPLRGLLVAGGLYNHSTATSDCSESYANGNDHDQEDEDDDNNNISSRIPNHNHQSLKRPRDQQQQHRQDRQQCNSQVIFNNTEAETGMMSAAESAAKRIRVDYAASDAASESSRNLDDLDDEDEQVISVS